MAMRFKCFATTVMGLEEYAARECKELIDVEVPGVEKKDINLNATEDRLIISVDTPQRKYYKEVDLPAKVDPKSAKASYKNGVLEVVLKKAGEERKGFKVQIE